MDTKEDLERWLAEPIDEFAISIDSYSGTLPSITREELMSHRFEVLNHTLPGGANIRCMCGMTIMDCGNIIWGKIILHTYDGSYPSKHCKYTKEDHDVHDVIT